MPITFTVKLPPNSLPQSSAPPGEYVVVTCPKCGKKTYGVAGQKGKKCPVCRHQYPMPDASDLPRFKTPEAACRYIHAEEAKRAGRLDFAPVAGGFRPAACAPIIPRTDKQITDSKSIGAQFAAWARHYFLTATGSIRAGVPLAVVIAAATKAGFAEVDKLVEKAVASGLLVRPKPYSVWLAKIADH